MSGKTKDPKRQAQGAISRAKGKKFEQLLEAAFDYYARTGFAAIEKTPEPMKVCKSVSGGKFLAFFEKRAQPDYKGTIKGGRSVMFEAKFTSAEKMEQNRVIQEQSDCLTKHQKLGATCFILAGFGSGEVYRVPWNVWNNMSGFFGRKYVREDDLQEYRVPIGKNGIPLILN